MILAQAEASRATWLRRTIGASRIALAAAFALSGAAKLIYAPLMVMIFMAFESGYSLARIVGCLEIVGAAMLLFQSTLLWGAWLLVLIAAGAVWTHLALIGGPVLPAVALLAMLGIVIWDRSTP